VVDAQVITLSVIVAGVVLAALGYQLMEMWVLHRSCKEMPPGPVAGVEALVGSEAEVIESFRRSAQDGALAGRVKVRGESWKAELPAETPRLATIGEHVRIVSVSGLVLKVVCH
jgi:membrane protein implicated in regulation of membrane protease activity